MRSLINNPSILSNLNLTNYQRFPLYNQKSQIPGVENLLEFYFNAQLFKENLKLTQNNQQTRLLRSQSISCPSLTDDSVMQFTLGNKYLVEMSILGSTLLYNNQDLQELPPGLESEVASGTFKGKPLYDFWSAKDKLTVLSTIYLKSKSQPNNGEPTRNELKATIAEQTKRGLVYTPELEGQNPINFYQLRPLQLIELTDLQLSSFDPENPPETVEDILISLWDETFQSIPTQTHSYQSSEISPDPKTLENHPTQADIQDSVTHLLQIKATILEEYLKLVKDLYPDVWLVDLLDLVTP